MRIHLAGVRGSLPAPLTPQEVKEFMVRASMEAIRRGFHTENEVREFLETTRGFRTCGFGGNTSCVQVESPKHALFIDAGSGIRALGLNMKSPCEVHILFTHFHWDHLIGLMFFNPIFIEGNTIHLYAVQPELEEAIRTLFKKPYFPVNYEWLKAKIVYHQLAPRRPHRLGDIEYTPYQLDHPDPCWGYKIVHNGKTFSYCVDTECTRTSAAELGPDLPLYQGVDLMVFDAQYTVVEAANRVNWGHAAAPIGLDVAIREKIKKVYFVHHDPNASDADIAQAEKQTFEYYQWRLRSERKAGREVFEVQWKFAQEGEIITLE